MVVAALLVALVLGGAGAGGWWLLSDDDPARTSTSPDPSSSASEEQSGDDTAASDAESPAPEPSGRECWDGTRAATLSACPPLEGVDGMRYAFPSMDAVFDQCVESVPPPAEKFQAWRCPIALPAGGTADVVYSEYQTFELAESHYESKFDLLSTERGPLRVWAAKQFPRFWHASGMYTRDYSYSFSVVATSSEEANQGLAEVRARPYAELPAR